MIRLFLACVLVATSLAVVPQTSDLTIIKRWSKGMRAEICVRHSYTIDCGWDMRLEFSGPLTYFSMTRAKTKSRGELFRSETKPFVIVGNSLSNKVQASEACHRFDAYFTSPVNVSAKYSRICTEGRWTDIVKSNGSYECPNSNADKMKPSKSQPMADSNSSMTDGTGVQQCNLTTCERGDLSMTSQFWNWGIQGKVCVSYGVLVTCIFDIGLAFSGSIKDLKVDGMHVSDVIVSGQEFLYKLTLERDRSVQANKTVCHSYVAYHAPRKNGLGVKGSYLDECHFVNITVPASTRTLTPRTTTPRMTKPPAVISTDSFDFNNTFSVIVKASWETGQAGWMCVNRKSPLTCSNVVELSFSPPVLSLETPKMTILQGNHTDDESLFTLRSRIHSTSPHWTPHCFWFIVRYINRKFSTNVTLVNASQCNDVTTEMTTHTTFTTVADATESSSTTSQTTVTPATRFFNYTESLSKSMTFYLNQRAGNISDNSWRRQYPHKLTLADDGRDLSGGWYESTDFAKFNFPIAATTTTLLWGFLQWKDAYKTAGQLDEMYQLMKHSLDYLISCWDNDKQRLYYEVGAIRKSHTWSELETVNLDQLKSADLNQQVKFTNASSNGGSDLAGEMAAAMAAGSLVFKEKNPAYASVLLETAKQVYAFADKHRAVYQANSYDASTYFPSDGFMDELCWGAAWLLRATGNETYLGLAERAADLPSWQLKAYSWNYKAIGCYLLMHNYPTITQQDKHRYRAIIETFLMEPREMKTTTCGLNYYSLFGTLRYAANVALIALMAADSGINPKHHRTRAEKQIKYMLGANNYNMSYQIGFGPNFPKVPQFLGVMCSDNSTKCKVNKMPYIGALVSGPDHNDNYDDSEDRMSTDDVAIDYNAGFQSSLAGLIHLQQNNSLPNATPTCSEPTRSRRRRQARRRTLPVSD